MAKANITLPNGTKVTIEGSAEEVATLLSQFSGPSTAAPNATKNKKRRTRKSTDTSPGTATKRRKGPQPLIAQLTDGDYFKSKRTMGDIQKKLEELGHIYAQSSLSSPLLRLTKNHTLRRMKEKSGWVYVS